MSARRTAALAAALAGALVLAAPLAASAHVHVDPTEAEPGEAAELTFTVPNESDSATTVKVRIALPGDLGDVEAEPVDGWTERVAETDGTPSAVVFTAEGAGVGDGQTQTFVVRISSVPDTGSVLLPVAQTYSDGTVVDWDEPTPASGEEPERPAPTLYVNDAAPASGHGEEHAEEAEATPAASADAHDGHGEAEPAAAETASSTTAMLPLGLSVAALVVAVGALALAAASFLRRRT